MRTVFIYKITSPSGKIYVGQSINIKMRVAKYSTLNCKGQPRLYNSLKKYGWDNHLFEIIDECTEVLPVLYNMKETFWITYYDCVESGLNCNSGGDNRKHSQQTKDKLRKANLGKKHKSSTLELMKGRRTGSLNNKSRSVIDTETNIIYPSIKDVAEKFNMNARNLGNRLRGKYNNDTKFKFND